jgi:lipopolysaccharide export system protein LptA
VLTAGDAVFPAERCGRGGANGVVLTQCKNVLTGDRLKVDMTTGVSRVESDSNVKVLIEPSGQGCGSGPGAAKPSPAAMPSFISGKK